MSGGTHIVFLDDADIAGRQGLRRVIHPGQKHPGNPVLKAEMPWEGQVICGGTVRKEGGTYRMWYQCNRLGTYLNLYAESSDGVHWERPVLRQYPDSEGKLENNIFLTRHALRSDDRMPARVRADHNPNVLCVPHMGAEQRYTLISYEYGRTGYAPYNGYMLAHSRDGIVWTDGPPEPVIPGHADVGWFTYDEEDKVFRGIVKAYLTIRGFHRRSILATQSADALDWTLPQPAFLPDEQDDAWPGAPDSDVCHAQIYGMPIFRCESVLIGFPQIFRVTGIEGGKHDGTVELQLASSRDGLTWSRVGNREAVVPLGEPGSYDAGGAYGGNSLVVVGEEVRLYYTGHSATHGHAGEAAICMITWPRDRLVGLHADESGGWLELPAQAVPSRLHVNADAAHGEVLVTVPESDFSSRLTRDSMDHRVDLPGELEGKEVVIRLDLRSAEVFSLRWGQARL